MVVRLLMAPFDRPLPHVRDHAVDGAHDRLDNRRRRLAVRGDTRHGNRHAWRKARHLTGPLTLLLTADALLPRALLADVKLLLHAVFPNLDRRLGVLLMTQFTLHWRKL